MSLTTRDAQTYSSSSSTHGCDGSLLYQSSLIQLDVGRYKGDQKLIIEVNKLLGMAHIHSVLVLPK